MNTKLFQNKIYLKKSFIHGYGVFAKEKIQKGEVVEECYALVLQKDTDELIDYCFHAEHGSVLPLGFGCVYNHSDNPNVTYSIEFNNIVVFKALRLIHEGEELLSYYGDEWFSSRNLKPAKIPFFRRRLNLMIIRGLSVSAAILCGIQILQKFIH